MVLGMQFFASNVLLAETPPEHLAERGSNVRQHERENDRYNQLQGWGGENDSYVVLGRHPSNVFERQRSYV
jgi:hypothetical protein